MGKTGGEKRVAPEEAARLAFRFELGAKTM